MPRQPGVPELIVDPIAPGLKKPNPRMPRKKVRLTPKPGKGGGSTWMPEDPGRMRNVGGIKFGTPGAKMVDRVYNTY